MSLPQISISSFFPTRALALEKKICQGWEFNFLWARIFLAAEDNSSINCYFQDVTNASVSTSTIILSQFTTDKYFNSCPVY